MLRTPILLSLLFALGGCAHLGPGSIKGNRLDYNMAIQQTNDQELLLNLVRLKYRDRLYFMNVERVVSALEFNRSVGVGATFPPGGDPTVSLGPITAAYNEKPSIFYTPLEADEEMGRVTRTLTASGDYFDWGSMLEGVLRIESAPTQPEHAAVSVPYRGGWFYIRDEDLQSKTTFSLLAQLITLQAGPAVAGGAALSFSVGGR